MIAALVGSAVALFAYLLGAGTTWAITRGRHNPLIDSFDVEPATPAVGPIEPVLSPRRHPEVHTAEPLGEKLIDKIFDAAGDGAGCYLTGDETRAMAELLVRVEEDDLPEAAQ